MNVFLSNLPVFSLIFIGFICKKRFPNLDEFWEGSDKIVYYLFFPCLLILEISESNFNIGELKHPLLSVVISTSIVAILLFLLDRNRKKIRLYLHLFFKEE